MSFFVFKLRSPYILYMISCKCFMLQQPILAVKVQLLLPSTSTTAARLLQHLVGPQALLPDICWRALAQGTALGQNSLTTFQLLLQHHWVPNRFRYEISALDLIPFMLRRSYYRTTDKMKQFYHELSLDVFVYTPIKQLYISHIYILPN